LRRIVANLLDNALRHGGGAAVTLHWVSPGEGVRIQICDQGAGIPPAEREAVFRPFYRRDAARTDGGSGLGLAIVRQLANAYGWRVSLAERAGGGLCAEIEIPPSQIPQGQTGGPG
jgi:two-component system osmolarity sensor histidine kinase EnvZ